MSDDHIPFDDLLAHLLSGGSAGDSTPVGAHLGVCPVCAASLARLDAARATVRADASLTGPSAGALTRVKGLMPSSRPTASTAAMPGTLRRLIAALTFDSRTAAASQGFRGALPARMLTYAQGDVTLELEVEPYADDLATDVTLMGQLSLADEPFPAEVVAVGGRGMVTITQGDEFGVFTLRLAAGVYDLMVEHGQDVIVFTEIDVG